MRKVTMKSWLIIGIILLLILMLARPQLELLLNRVSIVDFKEYAIDFIDDSGHRIKMDYPAERIISLYSAHTENLFSLGLDREIIGVGTSDIYPYDALEKEVFDYRSDPEKVIAASPDLVIIRPFIERNSPDFVKSLRRSGIVVVSLYPDTFEAFESYIMKLAMLTGKEKLAEKKLERFHQDIQALTDQTRHLEDRVGVYFESSDREYKTVTDLSMASKAIEAAGGENIAEDAIPIEEGSSIATYGIEKIVEKGADIDVFVTQRGVMGAGGNLHSISIRPGFEAVKAVQEGRVYEINQKIISSPTFRFIKGVQALQRAFYPEIFCEIKLEEGLVTRRELSKIMVMYQKSMIFVPTKSYYSVEDRDHYYGHLSDVTYEDEDFDFIETALQYAYFDVTWIDEEEFFYPDQAVTREEFARILYLIKDLENASYDFLDKDSVHYEKIISAVLASRLMETENNYFKPNQAITEEDLIRGLGL